MSTKPLYLLISDGGDGSQSICFSFDDELVSRIKQDTDFTVIGDERMSGDGLQVIIIYVPVETTMEAMGISEWSILDRSDYPELFEELG